MKAVVWTKYGSPDGLHLREVEQPTVGDNDVLIRVHATTVTAGDTEVRSLKFPLWLGFAIRLYMGVFQPRNKVLGQELAGKVETVGKDVDQFQVGDDVFGATGMNFGAYAEFIRLCPSSDGSVIAIKPSNQRYSEAAAVPVAGLEALYFVRGAAVQAGQKVLVYGAGGSIGTLSVQLAKHFGAEVTAVDSAGKLDMLRSIGADHVIDYQREDFTRNGVRYDAIIDVIGKSPFRGSIESLSSNGVYVLGNAGVMQRLIGAGISRSGGKRIVTGTAAHNYEALIELKRLIEAGKLKTVIDRSYPLAETAEAHRYVETGQKKGNVVIKVVPDDDV